jgi:UDPglucose 6-dehydrogenase
MAKICVIGTGYVGLVSGACLADFGNTVVCADVDQHKIEMLNAGKIPIFEPGLDAVVHRNVKESRLSFTTDTETAIKKSEVVFIAVGTPPADDGSADLRYVLEAAETIARAMASYIVIVDKSTVPVGTARLVHKHIQDTLYKYKKNVPFDVVSNPEFLREGSAVQDFMHPDRVVLGTESERALNLMKEVYRALYLNETPFIETNLETAEMIKYAANAFLAVKITFINEIANLCEKVGANVLDVARAMGKDGRISPKFLHPGPGYGGSCFPKDTKALADIGKKYGSPLSLVEATIISNEKQKEKMVEKIEFAVGNLAGTTIAILGLAFKPNTDDMRESPALKIIEGLVKKGAKCKVFDPAAMQEARWRLKDYNNSIEYCTNEYETMICSDALVLLTEWNQFRDMDLKKIKSLLKKPILIDLRNIYRRNSVESSGFTYYAVGQEK